MTSSIDTTLPVQGDATTASVRANFSAAKTEIEALQASDATAPGAAQRITGTVTLSSPATYTQDLVISTNGHLNITAATTLEGDILIEPGGQLTQSTAAGTYSGNITNNGTITINFATAFSGDVSLTGGVVAGTANPIFSGSLQAGRYKWYTGSGTVTLPTTLDEVKAEWFGVSNGATATVNQAAYQAAITAAPANSKVTMNQVITMDAGLSVASKSDLRITGTGKITLVGAGSTDRIFDLSGTIDNLRIDSLELVGENNAAYFQAGIGNDSGQTISNVCFDNLLISLTNVGISLNANSSGTYTKATVSNNKISNIVGVASGQGYGIHAAKCSNLIASGNIIDNCSRHGIYQASGSNVNNIWANNTVLNHRSAVATAALITSCNIARSTGVTFIGNKFIDFSDGAMYIAHETATSENCTDIKIIGNEFRGRQNGVAVITIGEQAVPGTYTTTHIDIENNSFYTDEATAGTGIYDINIYDGNYITIRGNNFRRVGLTTTTTYISVGNNSYISDDGDCEDVIIEHNDFIGEGTVTGTRAVSFATDISGNTSRHIIRANTHKGIALPTFHNAIPTNPNLSVAEDPRPAVLSTALGVAAGTTAGYAKTTVAGRCTAAGTTYSRSVIDDFWNLTAVTTGAGEYAKVLLCLDGAGTQARILKGDVAASQALALLPKIPDWDWVAVGVVELGPSYSGGALSTLYDIVGVYSQ